MKEPRYLPQSRPNPDGTTTYRVLDTVTGRPVMATVRNASDAHRVAADLNGRTGCAPGTNRQNIEYGWFRDNQGETHTVVMYRERAS